MTDIPQPPNIGSSILKGGCPIVWQHGHDHHPTTARLKRRTWSQEVHPIKIKNHFGRIGIKTNTVDIQKTAIIYFVRILKSVWLVRRLFDVMPQGQFLLTVSMCGTNIIMKNYLHNIKKTRIDLTLSQAGQGTLCPYTAFNWYCTFCDWGSDFRH